MSTGWWRPRGGSAARRCLSRWTLDQRRTFIIVAEGPIGGGANPNEVLAIVETDPTGARLPRGSSTPSLAVEEAAEMPAELLGHAVLAGGRGGPALDPDQLGTVVSALGQVLVDNPDLKEIEINPLRVTRSGLIALDAVVTRRSTDGQPDQ